LNILNTHYILFKKSRGNQLGYYYWHFLFGYLLPLVDSLNGNSHAASSVIWSARRKRNIYVESCGPVMDQVMKEVLNAMHLRYKIIGESEVNQFTTNVIELPAWDEIVNEKDLLMIMKAAVQLSDLMSKQICGCQHRTALNKIVLLDRSPAAQDRNIAHKHKAYGRNSRRILNLPELKSELIDRGLDAVIYEPGVHKLCCQISVFRSSNAIVGIRGAEFANLVWARDSIPLILINPEKMMGEPIQKRLAMARKMKYFQIDKSDMVVELFKQDIANIGNVLLNVLDKKIMA